MSRVELALYSELLRVTFTEGLPSPTERLFLKSIAKLEKKSEQVYERQGVPIPTVRSLVAQLQKAREVTLVGDAAAALKELASTEEDFAARVDEARRIREKPPEEFKAPNFKRKLLPHQVGPAAHLHALRAAANFSVPGAGKTSVVLAAYDRLKSEGIVEKLLVVCPRSAFRPWEDEFVECFGRSPASARIAGTPNERQIVYNNSRHHELFLSTYQMLSNDLQEIQQVLARHKFMVVLDESHYVKRLRGGKWAGAIMQIAPAARARSVLSGTPIPNGLEDLWSQITFLHPDKRVLGSQEQYETRLARGEEIASIRNSIHPYYWRVRKSDLGLPRATVKPVRVDFQPVQAKIYEALAIQVLEEVIQAQDDRMRFREWRKARVIRLLQAASNPTLLARASEEFAVPALPSDAVGISDLVERYSEYETPGKFMAVRRLVDTLVRAGEKVVIWSSFVHNLEMLDGLFQDIPHVVVHGGIARDANEDQDDNREDRIEDFKTNPETMIMIANPGACAESISLHRACTKAVFIDRTFHAAQFLQAMDRIHRVGLPKDASVEYYIMKTQDSIDDVVDARLDDKARVMRELLEGDITPEQPDVEDGWTDAEKDEERDFEAVLADLRRRYAANGRT